MNALARIVPVIRFGLYLVQLGSDLYDRLKLDNESSGETNFLGDRIYLHLMDNIFDQSAGSYEIHCIGAWLLETIDRNIQRALIVMRKKDPNG